MAQGIVYSLSKEKGIRNYNVLQLSEQKSTGAVLKQTIKRENTKSCLSKKSSCASKFQFETCENLNCRNSIKLWYTTLNFARFSKIQGNSLGLSKNSKDLDIRNQATDFRCHLIQRCSPFYNLIIRFSGRINDCNGSADFTHKIGVRDSLSLCANRGIRAHHVRN
jgi:hypothetical protein